MRFWLQKKSETKCLCTGCKSNKFFGLCRTCGENRQCGEIMFGVLIYDSNHFYLLRFKHE